MKKNKRTYLTYLTNNGDTITLAFRSKKSLNEHINTQHIDQTKIIKITNKMPINPNLTDKNVNNILEMVGERSHSNTFRLKI